MMVFGFKTPKKLRQRPVDFYGLKCGASIGNGGLNLAAMSNYSRIVEKSLDFGGTKFGHDVYVKSSESCPKIFTLPQDGQP
jgi:hypothetical protein